MKRVSPIGTKRTSKAPALMSVIGRKADIDRARFDVRFDPKWLRPLAAIPQQMLPETLRLIAIARVGPLPAQRKALDGYALNDNGWFEEPAPTENKLAKLGLRFDGRKVACLMCSGMLLPEPWQRANTLAGDI